MTGYRAGIFALLLLFVLASACSAIPPPPQPQHGPPCRLIVVVANRLLLSDLDNPALPTIYEMLHDGAIALVSPNCAGPKTEASVLLTANAGSPCRGGIYLKEFFDADEILPDGETAGQAYKVRTGLMAPKGSAVFLGLGQALRENAELSSVPAKIGALGDALRAAGIKTCALGNADLLPVIDRSVAVLAMDSWGIVDYGGLRSARPAIEIAATGAQSPPSRTGKDPTSASFDRLRMPFDRLRVRLPATRKWVSAIVYFGASTRLDETRTGMSDSAYVTRKAEMLRELDSTLLKLTSQPETCNQPLILVSFSPPTGAAWDQLTPIIVYRPVQQPELLNSPTTRTPGLIAASDFAPTVLGLFGASESGEGKDPTPALPASGRESDMIGRAAVGVPEDRGVEKLAEMSARVTANQRVLTPVAIFLVALGALSFTPTALIVAFGLKPSRRVIELLKIGLTAGATTFAALLLAVLAPAGAAGYIGGTAVSIVLLTLVCLGLAFFIRRRVTMRALPVVLVFGTTVLIIIADALTGCNLCKWSGPSSYQITGMRFYGIGNEYAGVLVSMAALAALFSPGRRWIVPIVGLVTIITLGLGNLGANYGGTAAAVVTFGLLWLAVSRKGFRAGHVALVFGLAIAVVIGFAVLDWVISGTAGTHAARATGLTEKLGMGYLGSIAMRKMLFNLSITFSEQGLHYALAFVPFLGLWFWKVQGKARDAFKADVQLLAGMKAVLIGAAAAFLLNDSGIIFAGIMIAITVLVLLYSFLENITPCPES